MVSGYITGGLKKANSNGLKKVAALQVPGQVIKVELDDENGFLVYEIDIRTQTGVYEVHVNAATGQILKIEREDDRF